jgi:segregation and condensation protein B
MELLKQQIQALIFCSEQSISIDEIASSLKLSFDWDLKDEEILAAIEEIKLQFESDEYSFELAEISEGYQFLTKKQYYPAVSALIQHKAKKKLSVSQMETLAIIAYRQPIPKSEIEHIRGVSCDYAMQKLLEKELIEISGKSDGPGRPVLYSTSRSFMDYFGIKSVKDLPQLKDLHVEGNEIGTPADVMTDEPVSPSDELVSYDTETVTEMPSAEIQETKLQETENPENIVSEETNETAVFSDSETTVFGTSEEEIVDVKDSDEEQSEIEDFSDDFPSEELPDRKSIFIENELNKEVHKDEEDSEE